MGKRPGQRTSLHVAAVGFGLSDPLNFATREWIRRFKGQGQGNVPRTAAWQQTSLRGNMKFQSGRVRLYREATLIDLAVRRSSAAAPGYCSTSERGWVGGVACHSA
jgi:hypothetical protein